MSARKYSHSFPLVAALLGTLAFSLSTLPGHEGLGESSNASTSSEIASTTCDSESNLIRGNCEIMAKNGVSALVSSKLEKGQGQRWNKERGEVESFADPRWTATMNVVCSKTGTVDCPDKVKVEAKDPSSLNEKIVAKLKEVAKAATEAFEAAKKDKEKKDAIAKSHANCETDKEGNKFKSDEKVADCHQDQMARLDSKEAAKYFEKKVQPKIVKLLRDPETREEGLAMLNEYKDWYAGEKVGNSRISKSLLSLTAYNKYAEKTAELTQLINNPELNARTRLMYAQQLAGLENAAQRTFKGFAYGLKKGNGTDWNSMYLANNSYYQSSLHSMAMLAQQEYLDQVRGQRTQLANANNVRNDSDLRVVNLNNGQKGYVDTNGNLLVPYGTQGSRATTVSNGLEIPAPRSTVNGNGTISTGNSAIQPQSVPTRTTTTRTLRRAG